MSTNQSFRLCTSNEFRDLLSFLNSDVDQWLPRSQSTIREWVLRQYKYHKEPLKIALGSARSKIHISCDLWTSNNHLAILGVIAHYVSEEEFLRSKVLGMKSIVGGHTAEDQAPWVLEVVEDYGIALKLGYFVMDNDSTNDKMLREFSRGL